MEFINTHGKPHKSALSDIISRWIKQDELGKAGINTNVYTAQNCKAASTSKTRGNGISITEILKEGCWKSEIRTFYSRDIINNNSREDFNCVQPLLSSSETNLW